MSNGDGRTKNEKAWIKLFEKYEVLKKIAHNGYFQITAAQINEFREARLMAKFDHKVNLPTLFLDNNLAILPITRGSYIISKMEVYKNFDQLDGKIRHGSFICDRK